MSNQPEDEKRIIVTIDAWNEMQLKLSELESNYECQRENNNESISNINQMFLKHKDKIEALEKDNKRLEEHRILGNKTMTKFLNEWTIKVKNNKEVLQELVKRVFHEKKQEELLKKLEGEKPFDVKYMGAVSRPRVSDEKPDEPFSYEQIRLLDECGLVKKEPTDPIANITQIIEIYDNGHEHEFYPDTHIVVKKAKFKFYWNLAWDRISAMYPLGKERSDALNILNEDKEKYLTEPEK